MQVSVENAQGLERRMTIAVPAQKINDEVQKRLQSLSQRVKVDGFRPGKVPFSLVKQRFGGQVRQEVVGDLVTSSFYEAAQQQNLRPAGTPVIEKQSEDGSKGLEFTARFEIYPEIAVKGVESIKVTRPKVEIGEADVDNMIDKLRKQRVTWEDVSRKAQQDDRITMDYVATADGQPFDGGEGKGIQVVIGSRTMIPGFEDGLLGASAGQTVELDLSFPDPYFRSELSGKKAHFSVTVNNVEKPVLPEINNDFAMSFGIADGDLSKLRAELQKNMQRELDSAIRSRVKNAVMDGLLSANRFDVPKSMADAEAERLAQQMNDQYRWQAGTRQNMSLYNAEQFKEQGQRRVALGLILAELIKQNNLKAAPSKVRREIEIMASAYSEPQSVIDWYYQDRNRLREIESVVLEEEIVDWVLEKAQVTDSKATFDEVMSSSVVS